MLVFNTEPQKKLIFNATPTTAQPVDAFSSLRPDTGTVANSTPSITVQPGATMLQDAAAAIVRAPFRATQALTTTVNKAVGVPLLPQFNAGPVSKAALGSEPVQTIPEAIKTTQQNIQAAGVPSAVAGPFGAFTTLGSLALDFSPLGGEENALKQIAKAKTALEAEQLARSMHIAEDLIPTAREAFLKASNTSEAKAALDSLTNLQKTTKTTPEVVRTVDSVVDNSPRAITREAAPLEQQAMKAQSLEQGRFAPEATRAEVTHTPSPTRTPALEQPSVSYRNPITKDLPELSKAVDSGINLDRLAISEEGKNLVAKTVDEVRPQLEAIVGKALSNKEALDLADNSSKLLARAVSHEDTLKWEAAMTATRQKLAHMAETGTVDKEFVDTLLAVKTIGTDIGRKLQSLSITAAPKAGNTKQALVEAVLKATDDADAVIEAAKGVDFNDFKQASAFYRHFIQPQAREWIDLLRYNSMLSSPKTHIVNVFSNAVNSTLVAAVEKLAVGSIDFLRSSITGTPRQRLVGEAGQYVKGYLSNVRGAAKRFGDVLSGKAAMTNLDTKGIPLATSGLPSAVEKALSVPMRLLEASDQFFTELVASGERAGMEYLQSKGIQQTLIDKRVDELAAYRLYRQDLFPEGQGTLLNAIDEFTSKLMSLRENRNVIVSTLAKFTVPFVKTPMNIFKQGLEYSPLGFATMIKTKDAQLQLSKAMVGSSMFLGGAILLTSDRLSWAEPLNPDEKNAYRDAGKQPYSVKVGDTWVSYQKLPPPIAFPLSMIAALHDGYQKGGVDDTTFDRVLAAVAKYGNFLADQSYAKSIGDLLSAVRGGADGLEKVAANYAQQLIPYRALSGWLARLVDHTQRQPDPDGTFIDKEVQYLMSQIPGLSKSVPARANAEGKAIELQHPFLNAFSPANVSDEDQAKAATYDQALTIKKYNQDAKAKSNEFKQQAEQTWGELKDLPKEDIKARLRELAKENPNLVEKVLDVASDEKQGLNYSERQLKNATIEARAQFIFSQKATFKTDAEWKSYLKDLAAKKILTESVIERMVELKAGQPKAEDKQSLLDKGKGALAAVQGFMGSLGPQTVGEARKQGLMPLGNPNALKGLPDDAPIPEGLRFFDPMGAVGAIEKVGAKTAGKIASSVLQVVNHATGETKFFRIAASELERFKTLVDDGVKGMAGIPDKAGNVFHITAKTPQQMLERGFTDGGIANLDMLPTKVTSHARADGTIPVKEYVKSNSDLKPKFRLAVERVENRGGKLEAGRYASYLHDRLLTLAPGTSEYHHTEKLYNEALNDIRMYEDAIQKKLKSTLK